MYVRTSNNVKMTFLLAIDDVIDILYLYGIQVLSALKKWN